MVGFVATRTVCGTFPMVRRVFVVVTVGGSLLWAVTGGSVIASSLHDHCHHPEGHDHQELVQTALHGHSHEGSPEHTHRCTAFASASRAPSAGRISTVTA
jgi:hypothetical protein